MQLKLTKNCGEHAVSRAQVFRWYKAFLDGQDSVEDEPCSGRPCTSKTDENVTKVRALVRTDQRLTVRMIGIIMRSLNNSGKGFIVSGQRLQTHGCCITTTLPVTLPSSWTNFWPKRVFQWFRSPHTRLIWVHVTFLFPKLKFHLKGRHFGTVDNIQKVVTEQLRPLPHEDFQHCYWEWEQCLRRCVASQGGNVDL